MSACTIECVRGCEASARGLPQSSLENAFSAQNTVMLQKFQNSGIYGQAAEADS